MLNRVPALVSVYGRGVTFYESLEVSALSKLILTNEKVGTGFLVLRQLKFGNAKETAGISPHRLSRVSCESSQSRRRS